MARISSSDAVPNLRVKLNPCQVRHHFQPRPFTVSSFSFYLLLLELLDHLHI